MSLRTYTRSFAAGELSPQLFGRLDLAKFQTGLALCRNFQVAPQGPVHNRPGFQFVRACKHADKRAVLIPFSYNSEQSFALEFGAGYIRFHALGGTLMSGGVPYEIASPYAEADLFDLHYVQSADVMTICHQGYAPRELRRLGPTNWTLTAVSFAPEISAPTGVTASASLAQTVNVTGITQAAPGVLTLASALGAAVGETVFARGIGGMVELTDGFYAVNTAPSSTTMTLKTLDGGVPVDTTAFTAFTTGGSVVRASATSDVQQDYVVTALGPSGGSESLPSLSASCSNVLSVAGAYNTVSWTAVAGAERYNVYKAVSGLYGFIGQTTDTSFRDTFITPDTSKTPPLSDNPFATNNPRAVSYFEQRRCFGGSATNPQTIWMTRSGTEANMNYSVPTQDDDPITARIVAREANTIRHLVPLGDLLALTSGGVWRIASTDNGALTPASFSARPQSYVGASNVQPIVTSNSVLYAPDRGSHIREVSYRWETQTFQADDISVMAPHLFDYQSIVQLAYSRSPLQTLWAVRGDGVLLGLTHMPEHEVKAWHQHDTQGAFESVCSIAEGDEDGVYVVVRRQINGQVVRYVERLHSRQFSTVADAFFVDAGLTYSGAPVTTISGLDHLEGMEVVALADGGVETAKTVTGGQIRLDAPATKVHVGLAYTCDIQTMPLALEAAAAMGQGTAKNINKALLRVYRSSGVSAGPSFGQLRPYDGAGGGDDDFDDAAALEDSVLEIRLPPSWQRDGQLCVRQANPLPLTVLSMTLEVATGG